MTHRDRIIAAMARFQDRVDRGKVAEPDVRLPKGHNRQHPQLSSGSLVKRKAHTRAPNCCEYHEQEIVVDWLSARGLVYCHVVNDAWQTKDPTIRKAIQRWLSQKRRIGMRKGVPDVLVFSPALDCVGVAIEMKRGPGCDASPEQGVWINMLIECGWCAFVGLGATHAIKRLGLLYGE